MLAHKDDIFNGLLKVVEHGFESGKYLGYPESIDKHYSVLDGSCTDLTGYPHSGKSYIVLDWELNLSLEYGYKHLLYVPDMGDALEVYADLVHRVVMKTTDPKYLNRCTVADFSKEFEWIYEHFHIVSDTEIFTPLDFWNRVGKDGYNTGLVDAWFNLDHTAQAGRRDDQYLNDILSKRNKLAEKYKCHYFTVIHPKGPDGTCYKDGVLQSPTTHRLNGGAAWNNNGKTILSVHREDFRQPFFNINFLKVKPRRVGETGSCAINVNWALGRLYDINQQGQDQFAFNNKYTTKPEPIKLHENTDFDSEAPF